MFVGGVGYLMLDPGVVPLYHTGYYTTSSTPCDIPNTLCSTPSTLCDTPSTLGSTPSTLCSTRCSRDMCPQKGHIHCMIFPRFFRRALCLLSVELRAPACLCSGTASAFPWHPMVFLQHWSLSSSPSSSPSSYWGPGPFPNPYSPSP